MLRHMWIVVLSGLLAGLAGAAERPVQMKDLPAPVQKTVQEQSQGAELKGLSREVEKGRTYYEAETKVNGKSRDGLIDSAGAVVEVEEEIALEAVPQAARAAIERYAGGGKILLVESVTKNGTVRYEATIRKGLKKSEVLFSADGVRAKN